MLTHGTMEPYVHVFFFWCSCSSAICSEKYSDKEEALAQLHAGVGWEEVATKYAEHKASDGRSCHPQFIYMMLIRY